MKFDESVDLSKDRVEFINHPEHQKSIDEIDAHINKRIDYLLKTDPELVFFRRRKEDLMMHHIPIIKVTKATQ